MPQQCSKCKGSGYIKMDIKKCECRSGCYLCNGSGLKTMPYETCLDCFGDGTCKKSKSKNKNT